MTGPYREGAPPPRSCPRCRTALTLRPVGDDAVEECLACEGAFVRRTLVPRLLDALDLGGDVLETFERAVPRMDNSGPLYVPCPSCNKIMNRRQFALGAKVVIDDCQEHGIWFDKAELRAVVEFAAGGGMERAAEESQRREREEERAARIRALGEELRDDRPGEAGRGLLALLMSRRRR